MALASSSWDAELEILILSTSTQTAEDFHLMLRENAVDPYLALGRPRRKQTERQEDMTAIVSIDIESVD
jgi:hypothetical protein